MNDKREAETDYNRAIGYGGVGEEQDYFTTRTQSEVLIGAKKYGELAPKKKPLMSKDHKREFFDTADLALCKQGSAGVQTSAVAVESLRPKLKRTPHHKLPPRMPACTSGGDVVAE